MKVKKSIICKNVNDYSINTDIIKSHAPQAGDVAIFEVLNVGKHHRIQCSTGKNQSIFQGDFIMMAFGSRYATAQLHGVVPTESLEIYHILGQGGVVGIVESLNANLEAVGPTEIKLLGFLMNSTNQVINTKNIAPKLSKFNPNKTLDSKLILSLGGSMDSGKTTTAAYLCRGLASAGKKTAFIKLTGTVVSKDVDYVVDCGAHLGIDFSAYGFPSTYLESTETLLDLFESLTRKVMESKPEFIVMEIADGLLQRETEMLIKSDLIDKVDHVLYSDSNSTGAYAGLQILKQLKLTPIALCGAMLKSPLMIEEVKQRTSIPVLSLNELANKSILSLIEVAENKNSNSTLAKAV